MVNNVPESQDDVFSTCVEVILRILNDSDANDGILHVCRGDPRLVTFTNKHLWYSPRVWR